MFLKVIWLNLNPEILSWRTQITSFPEKSWKDKHDFKGYPSCFTCILTTVRRYSAVQSSGVMGVLIDENRAKTQRIS